MIEKGVKLVVSAKNGLKAGLDSAAKSAQSFGQKLGGLSLFKFAGWATALMTVKKVFSVFSSEVVSDEKAVNDLQNTFKLFGETTNGVAQDFQNFSEQLEKSTGVEDDRAMAIITDLKLTGMRTEKIKDATKAVIALSRAGMGDEKASRAVAMAYNGDYDALQRYIPALKTANSETEKAKIVNDFLTKQFALQAGSMDTVSGRLGTLKIAFANLGAAIDQRFKVKEGFSAFTRDLTVGLRGLSNIFKGENISKGLFDEPIDDTQIKIASQNIEILQEKLADNAKKIAEEQSRLDDQNHQDVIRQNQEEIASEQELARMSIAAIIEKSRAEKRGKEDTAKEQEKYNKLVAKDAGFVKGGSRRILSKKDQEFIKAFREREAAQGFIGGLQGNIDAAQKALQQKETDKLVKPINELVKEQTSMNDRLEQLLKLG